MIKIGFLSEKGEESAGDTNVSTSISESFAARNSIFSANTELLNKL